MGKTLKISLIAIPAVLIIAIIAFSYNILNKPSIYNGVKVEETNVGGLSKEDAKKHLRTKLDDKLGNKEISLTAPDYSKKVKYSELGIKYDYDKAMSSAYQVGREGNVFSRLQEIYKVSTKGKIIDIEIVKDNEKISNLSKQLNEELHEDPKDATIKYSSGKFLLTDEVVGKSVNIEKLTKDIDSSIGKAEFVEVPMEKVEPKVTRELLSNVKEEIGSYSTEFKLNDSNRVFNVARAASSVDDKVILPGETFSFNKTTGPRSLKAGYKQATVIVNGEFVPGEGGGVCQVSSTLYNTLLDSGVSIVERHSHSLPISYVPKGRDATVAYDVLDLKFRNDYNSPVYIKSYVSGNVLTVKLYGNKDAKTQK